MEPLEVKLTWVGNSTTLYIPNPLPAFLSMKPGMRVKARLEGSPWFEAELRQFSNSLGLIVPAAILAELGLKRGDTVLVPFGDWQILKRPAPQTKAKQKR